MRGSGYKVVEEILWYLMKIEIGERHLHKRILNTHLYLNEDCFIQGER